MIPQNGRKRQRNLETQFYLAVEPKISFDGIEKINLIEWLLGGG
jgi:hypothetical protein